MRSKQESLLEAASVPFQSPALICSLLGSHSSAWTHSLTRDVLFEAVLIETIQNPSYTHPSTTQPSHISSISGGPSVLPPECFPSSNRHANLQCGEKKVARQQFAFSTPNPSLLMTATANPPPPPPRSVSLLLFPDTAVLCQCVTSQRSSPENVKTFPAAPGGGMEEWLPYGLHLCPFFTPSYPSFFTGVVVDGHDGSLQ